MSTSIDGILKDLGSQLTEVLQNNDAAADASKAVKALGQSTLAKLDLVTREEFDAQKAVLLKTREKLEALEAQLEKLQTPT